MKETEQMRKRITYCKLTYQIPEEQRKEIRKVCADCTARLYLEGKGVLDNPLPIAADRLRTSSSDGPSGKRQRTSILACCQQLAELRDLLHTGLLSQEEFDKLKARLLSGE